MTDGARWHSQVGFDLRIEWGPHGLRRLAPICDVIVIVDVLTFTTDVDVALGRGATVLPYRQNDGGGPAFAAEHDAVLAVPRHEVDADHPFSLSPTSLAGLPAGARVVLPSPNGSALAFGAIAAGAGTVLAGCLRNASAVAAAATRAGRTIGVVPAGERWNGATGPLRPALEDLLGAGAILAAAGGRSRSPEAAAAVAAFEEAAGDLEGRLRACGSGRELAERGYATDVEIAAALDVSGAAPALSGSEFVDLRN